MPARVSDRATCAGPPDTIVTGEPTALIGGKPAARLGDTTAHEGIIVTGCATVLIGSAKLGSKAFGCGSFGTTRRNLETKAQPTLGRAEPTLALTRHFLFCRK